MCECRFDFLWFVSVLTVSLFTPTQTHLQFSNEFASAIEKKQVAQQDAERFKFVVRKSEQERLAAIIKAQSEADAADLVSKAFRQSGSALIEMRRLEAAQEIAENLR